MEDFFSDFNSSISLSSENGSDPPAPEIMESEKPIEIQLSPSAKSLGPEGEISSPRVTENVMINGNIVNIESIKPIDLDQNIILRSPRKLRKVEKNIAPLKDDINFDLKKRQKLGFNIASPPPPLPELPNLASPKNPSLLERAVREENKSPFLPQRINSPLPIPEKKSRKKEEEEEPVIELPRKKKKKKKKKTRQAPDEEIVIPDFSGLSDLDVLVWKEDYRRKWNIMRGIFQEYGIEEFPMSDSLEVIFVRYQSYVNMINGNQTRVKYRCMLMIVLFGLEVVTHDMLGLPTRKFAEGQLANIKSYEMILMEMTNFNIFKAVAAWSPAARLMFLVAFNFGTVLIIGFIQQKFGHGADYVVKLLKEFTNSDPPRVNVNQQRMQQAAVQPQYYQHAEQYVAPQGKKEKVKMPPPAAEDPPAKDVIFEHAANIIPGTIKAADKGMQIAGFRKQKEEDDIDKLMGKLNMD